MGAGGAKASDTLTFSARLSRQAVYIANVVKCRPPGNRTPELDEMAACSPLPAEGSFWRWRPGLRAIVALWRTPTQYLLRLDGANRSGLRGPVCGLARDPWPCRSHHPAYLLRTCRGEATGLGGPAESARSAGPAWSRPVQRGRPLSDGEVSPASPATVRMSASRTLLSPAR